MLKRKGSRHYHLSVCLSHRRTLQRLVLTITILLLFDTFPGTMCVSVENLRIAFDQRHVSKLAGLRG